MPRQRQPLATPQTPIASETLPGGKATPGLMPAPPPQAAGEPENTNWSPAGPGKPVDGSPAVNTYTPRNVQAAEFEAGTQDWQDLVAGDEPNVQLPPGTPAPDHTDENPEPPPPPESKPESQVDPAEGNADRFVRTRRSI